MSTAGDIGTGLGAAGDLFGGIAGFAAGKAAAKGYKAAAKFAAENAIISQEAGEIKLAQAGRQVYKTLGAQSAGYASAGLTSGGSAEDVFRSSIMQGGLEKAIINQQTQINVKGYQAQSAQFQAMAAAAKKGGIGALIGGVLKAGAAIAPLLSDRRLKTDIKWVGSHGALGLYRFRYINHDEVHVGVMADEVAIHAPYALGPLVEGYATVDYGKIGLGHLAEAF